MRIAILLALNACAPLQVPGIAQCGYVQVRADLAATAAHCPQTREVVYRDEVADLMLLRIWSSHVDRLALEISEPGRDATLRGMDFTVTDPLRFSEGRIFLITWPQLEPGSSGFGLWSGGELLGIASHNDPEPDDDGMARRGVFVHAGEIARAMQRVK